MAIIIIMIVIVIVIAIICLVSHNELSILPTNALSQSQCVSNGSAAGQLAEHFDKLQMDPYANLSLSPSRIDTSQGIHHGTCSIGMSCDDTSQTEVQLQLLTVNAETR